jgi:hypothetical protein
MVAEHQSVWDSYARFLGVYQSRRLAHAINHATPEQCAEAMTRCTPEQEEIARRFEDAGK